MEVKDKVVWRTHTWQHCKPSLRNSSQTWQHTALIPDFFLTFPDSLGLAKFHGDAVEECTLEPFHFLSHGWSVVSEQTKGRASFLANGFIIVEQEQFGRLASSIVAMWVRLNQIVKDKLVVSVKITDFLVNTGLLHKQAPYVSLSLPPALVWWENQSLIILYAV